MKNTTQLISLILTAFLFSSTIGAQNQKTYRVHAIAFYNLENLFDTKDDPEKFDDASPIMEISGDREEVYKKKVHNMARVIADLGKDVTNNAPAILGVSEIENLEVLMDVANDSLLRPHDYGIVHYNSPDNRGIDVALMYQKALFTPTTTSSHELRIFDNETRKRVYTRDQLLVSGFLEEELIHIIVNHWPSRRGGEARSRSKRVAAAKLNRKIIDSLHSIDPYAKILTMGDLNDDPTNKSVKDVLNAKDTWEKVPLKGLYNPFGPLFANGLGTTAYRDTWSLFDQIIISKSLLERDFSSFRFYKAGIYNKLYLTEKKGRWKGYPKRSFSNGNFTDGFSDHFPVYVLLIKEQVP